MPAPASARASRRREDRITRAAWFLREHDEVPPPTWKLPAVKSAVQLQRLPYPSRPRRFQ